MTLYEKRLAQDLDALRTSVSRLASDVERNLRDAVRALLDQDVDQAYRTIIADSPVNRQAEAIDARSHQFIARHLPSAGHLRLVSTVVRMVIGLERMGDYAATICRQAASLEKPLSGTFRREVQAMADDAFQMFGQAMKAFAEQDESLARGTMGYAEQVDRDFEIAYNMLLEKGAEELTVTDLFGRLIIITQLERVSDQAKNLCEETVFALSGKTKVRRPVRILFIDETDDAVSQLATAIGRKQFVQRGVFESAGARGSTGLNPEIAAFMDRYGYDPTDSQSKLLEANEETMSRYDVIISLGPPVADLVPKVPFRTVAFRWEMPPGKDWSEERLEATYRMLSTHIADLLETLRGPVAA